MAIDKRISYDVQGGVKNYLGKQKEVTAPVKWKSSPDHPETELAYITKAEKDLLVKKDLHGSLKGGVNRGPSGIMSLNGFGSADPGQNVSGSQMSAAESGNFSGFSGTGGGGGPQLPPGVDRKPSQLAQDIRSAAIAAGAGQRVNPGFFDSRNTVSPAELARAKAFNPTAFRAGRKNSLMDMLASGGIFGSLVRKIGQNVFGLGKRYNQPTYDMSGIDNTRVYENILGPSTNPNNVDIYNEFVDEEDNEEDNTQLFNFGDTTVPSSSYDMAGVNTPFAQQAPEEFVSQFLPNTDIYNQQTTRYQKRPEQVETDIFFRPQLQPEKSGILDFEIPGFRVEDKYVDALTTPTMGQYGLNLMQLNTLKNAGYSNSQIEEAVDKGYANELVRDIEGPIGIV